MRVLISEAAVRRKYEVSWAAKIIGAAGKLGDVVDVSGKSSDEVRALIAKSKVDEPHVLLGGYDLIPPFERRNPTDHMSGDDDDDPLPTDTPYGAAPGSEPEEFVPSRIVARIPDATGSADPADFIKVIRFQEEAPHVPTPSKRFEECAAEFETATRVVAKSIPGGKPRIVMSPPAKLRGAPDVVKGLSGAGRVHILLHGANYSSAWCYLWGKGTSDSAEDIEAVSARQIDLCDLRGAIVTFSSCYAAMLDSGDSQAGRRSETNQVALACLGHGAKLVIASTRSNWISDDGMSLGPALIAEFWRQLAGGKRAGVALRDARAAYVKHAFSTSARADHRYILKTALQAQLYGNPEAKL